MKLYSHLACKETKVIINLKNQNTFHYAIAKTTSISVGKVKRCVELAKHEKSRKPMINQSWKWIRVYYGYSLAIIWKNEKLKKLKFKVTREKLMLKKVKQNTMNLLSLCTKSLTKGF